MSDLPTYAIETAAHGFVRALGEGIETVIDLMMKDPSFTNDIALYANISACHGGYREHIAETIRLHSSAYDVARKVLGDYLITPDEVMASWRSVMYRSSQIVELASSFPEAKVLALSRECHVIPNPPLSMSLSDLLALDHDTSAHWNAAHKFAHKEFVSAHGWVAFNVSFGEKRGVGYMMNAAEAWWRLKTFRAVNGYWPLQDNVSIMTSSRTDTGNPVCLEVSRGSLIVVNRHCTHHDGTGAVVMGRYLW